MRTLDILPVIIVSNSLEDIDSAMPCQYISVIYWPTHLLGGGGGVMGGGMSSVLRKFVWIIEFLYLQSSFNCELLFISQEHFN